MTQSEDIGWHNLWSCKVWYCSSAWF